MLINYLKKKKKSSIKLLRPPYTNSGWGVHKINLRSDYMLQKDRFLTKYKRFDVDSNTYASYNRTLNKLYDKFDLYSERNFVDITSDDIEDWLEDMTKDHKKSSLNLYIEHLAEFFGYLQKKDLVQRNPMKAIRRYGEKEVEDDAKDKYIATIEDIRKLLNSTDIKEKGDKNFKFVSKRDKALLAFLVVSGCRQTIARILTYDMMEEIDNGIAFNIDGKYTKSGKDQRIVIGNKALEYLKDHLKTVEECNMKCEYIFSSYRRKQLGAKEVRDIMDKAKRKAKLDIEGKQFSPHCLRNFLATYLVNKEVNPILIREICHWSQDKGDMLSRYATKDIKKFDQQKIEVTNIL